MTRLDRSPAPVRGVPFASLRRAPALRLIEPVGRMCAAGADGACLACDAPQGEPCRRRGVAP